jgi:hypothetical protein
MGRCTLQSDRLRIRTRTPPRVLRQRRNALAESELYHCESQFPGGLAAGLESPWLTRTHPRRPRRQPRDLVQTAALERSPHRPTGVPLRGGGAGPSWSWLRSSPSPAPLRPTRT